MTKPQKIEGGNKQYKGICEHLDWDNQKDCYKEAKYVCQCCGAGACEEHNTIQCPYGGMYFEEIED